MTTSARSRFVRSARALMSGLLILGASACSTSGGGAPSSASTPQLTPSNALPSSAGAASSAPQTAWELEAEPVEDHTHVDEDVVGDASAPTEEAMPDPGSSATPAEAGEEPLAEDRELDPCSLVTNEEWVQWSGIGTAPVPQPLEDGDACGWIAADDHLRMAIGAFPAASEQRWLTQDDVAGAATVAGIGDSAWWLESWPVGQSSTLVVEIGELDLVIEMSALQPDQEDLLEGARHFAEIAIERLP